MEGECLLTRMKVIWNMRGKNLRLSSTLNESVDECSIFVSQIGSDDKSGSVHTTPAEFENADLFLRLGLPSTLIRHENGALRKRFPSRRNLKTQLYFYG